jgi:hypothetical protein
LTMTEQNEGRDQRMTGSGTAAHKDGACIAAGSIGVNMRDTGKEDRIETYKGTVEEQPGTDMTAPQKSDIWQGGLPSRRKKRGMPRAVALVIVLAVLAGAAGGGYLSFGTGFSEQSPRPVTVAYREETVQNGPLTVGFERRRHACRRYVGTGFRPGPVGVHGKRRALRRAPAASWAKRT